MQIQMSGRNVTVTQDMRAAAEKKMQRLDRYKDNIISVHLIFNIEGDNHVVEGIVAVRGNSIHAKAESSEMYAAIDLLIDKLIRQLNKYKEKQKDHREKA